MAPTRQIATLRSALRYVFPAPDGLLLPSSVAPAVKDLNRVGYWLVPALLALSPLLLFAPLRDRFAVLCGAILLVTCVGHLLLLAFDIKLPLDRAALFLVPLATVIIAAVAARLEFAVMAILSLLVITFLAALRIFYFDRWQVNAGIKEAVIAAGDYAKARNLTVVGTTSGEAETGDFYRRLLGYEFELLKSAQGPDLNLSLQIVDRHTNSAGPLEEAGFKVIYENKISGMRVYAKPDGAAPTTGPGPDSKG